MVDEFVGISWQLGYDCLLYKTELDFARGVMARDLSDASTSDYIDICLHKPVEESRLKEMANKLFEELKNE